MCHATKGQGYCQLLQISIAIAFQEIYMGNFSRRMPQTKVYIEFKILRESLSHEFLPQILYNSAVYSIYQNQLQSAMVLLK
jgi:hypothetical protein